MFARRKRQLLCAVVVLATLACLCVNFITPENRLGLHSSLVSSQSSSVRAAATTSLATVNPTTEAPPNGFLAFEVIGRLGNQMFQYASAYGMARHNKRQLLSQGKFEICDYFALDLKHGDGRTKSWNKLTEIRNCLFDNYLFDLHGNSNREILVSGYLQSWKYFEHYFSDIRRMFKNLRPDIAQSVSNFFASLSGPPLLTNYNLTTDVNSSTTTSASSTTISATRSSTSSTNQAQTVYVGVHVRRGDMTSQFLHNYGMDTGDVAFISRSMRYFIDRFSHVTFIVCSDDLDWCRQNMTLDIPDELRHRYVIRFCDKEQPPITHLGILSACNHSIMTGGSYGWWSAFLAGGQTVYFKGYPRPSSEFAKHFSPSRADFYFPEWVGL